jgi:hypothetical protein
MELDARLRSPVDVASRRVADCDKQVISAYLAETVAHRPGCNNYPQVVRANLKAKISRGRRI